MPTPENPPNGGGRPARPLRWRKSGGCTDDDTCVEIARRPGTIAVRDGAAPAAGPVLDFTPREWREFLRKAAGGAYDL